MKKAPGTAHYQLGHSLLRQHLCEERIVHINSPCSEIDLLHHSAAILYFVSLFPGTRPASPSCIRKSVLADTMPLNTSAAMYRMRLSLFPLLIISLTVTWLALASLRSATVHFAVLLRDRARSDLVTPSDSILDITFQSLMDNVVDGMVIAALVSALFSIFGFVLVVYPKWLQEKCTARFYYGCIQIVVSMIVLSLGAWIASRVHVFQASFELFDRDQIPYYKIMYYGSIGQAASGIFTGHFVVCALCRTRLTWSLAEYAHRAYNTVKVRVPTAYKSRAVKNDSAGITNKNNCRII